jgi:hypothetical protein
MTTIYVDSRLSASGSDSSFTTTLRETVHISQGARLRVDTLRFIDSFFTTDLGRHIYYKDGTGGLAYYTLPETAYTGNRLAAQLQVLTGRNTTYSDLTNAITQVVVTGQEFLSDDELSIYTSGFPSDASSASPKSINQVLGPVSFDSGNCVFQFVKMSPYDDLYLRSHKLTCHNVHGPRGEHDVLCKITLNQGIARVQESETPQNILYDIPPMSLKTIDFRLTDYLGQVVNLRGRSLSFQITIEQ